MANAWDKVTRWAGRTSEEGRESPMSEEQLQTDPEQTATHLEAGMEAPPELTPELPENPAVATLTAERDALKDRLARLQAEFDNARKRAEKERQDAREYTIGSTIEPFLAVMDNFLLALKAQGSADQLRSGVELILKQMEDALKNMQVVAVETVGAQFDPRIHEALGSIETAEFPDHQVIEEIRRGYKIRERLLRPAMVKIATNSAQVTD